MTDQDKSLIWWILGGVAAVLGIALVLDYKDQKRLENIVKTMDWHGKLDENNPSHKPLIPVSEELILMLNDSITQNGNKYDFMPMYPQALKLLTRATYEQTIKLYMTLNNIEFGKFEGLKSLEDKMTTHFNEHKNSEIGLRFKEAMELGIRGDGNGAAHNPVKSEEITLMLNNVEIFAKFVDHVMRSAKRS